MSINFQKYAFWVPISAGGGPHLVPIQLKIGSPLGPHFEPNWVPVAGGSSGSGPSSWFQGKILIHLVLHYPGVNMKGLNVSRLSVAFTPVPLVQDFIDYKLLVPIQNYSPCLAAFFLNDGFPNKRLVNSLYTDRSIFCLGRVPFWSLFLSSIFAY